MVSSQWAHGDHSGHGSGPNDHGSVTDRRGHSSVTAQSQLNHGIFSMITAQSRVGHSSITAQVTAQSRLAVTILVTVSSRWAHCELTVRSHGGQYFSHGNLPYGQSKTIMGSHFLTSFPMWPGYCWLQSAKNLWLSFKDCNVSLAPLSLSVSFSLSPFLSFLRSLSLSFFLCSLCYKTPRRRYRHL